MSKLTLKEKKLISDAVTGETKRCLSVIKKGFGAKEDGMVCDELDYKDMVKEIIQGSPYIEFNPELLKRIPK